MRFYWDNLFLRSYIWVVMSCYDYNISQNSHYGYITHTQAKQCPTRLSCSHKHVCGHTHTQIITKQGWQRGQVCLFTVVLPLCASMCVALSIHCVMGDKQLTSVTPLLTRAWLHWGEGGAERAREIYRRKKWKDGERERKKDERKDRERRVCLRGF